MIEQITTWIAENLSIQLDTQVRLFSTLVIILVIFFIWVLANAVITRRVEDKASLYRLRKSVRYLLLTLAVILIAIVWMRGNSSFATYLGLVSAALVIALQDPIINFVGWVFIITRRPFELEDRVELGDVAGDVIDIRFFQFTLMEIRNWVDADQSTGRILHIPNRKVFSENIANYTKGFTFLWNEIPVVLTFESDWRKAKKLLQQIADKHSAHLSEEAHERVRKAAHNYLIYYTNLTPIVYTKVVDHGVMLTVRYLCEPRQRRSTLEAIWEEILDIFDQEPTLEFAYPTQRLFYNPVEGPPELRPTDADSRGES